MIYQLIPITTVRSSITVFIGLSLPSSPFPSPLLFPLTSLSLPSAYFSKNSTESPGDFSFFPQPFFRLWLVTPITTKDGVPTTAAANRESLSPFPSLYSAYYLTRTPCERHENAIKRSPRVPLSPPPPFLPFPHLLNPWPRAYPPPHYPYPSTPSHPQPDREI